MDYKKVCNYKGWTIGVNADGDYACFKADEWSMGKGCRYPEFDGCGSVKECKNFIDCY